MITVKNRLELFTWMPMNGVVAEVGVALGKLSHEILKHTEPSRLYLVDIWDRCPNASSKPGRESDMRSSRTQLARYLHVCGLYSYNPRVSIIRADSLQVAELVFIDEMFDWVYIDSNHFYEHACKELAAYWPTIKPGGWLCGHDYVDTKWSGVKRAVDELLEAQGLEMGLLTRGRSPSFAIQKPKE